MGKNKIAQSPETVSTSENMDSKEIRNVDDVLKIIKPFGRYQILVTFVYAYAYLPEQMNNLFMGYGGLKPKWTCGDSNLTLVPTDDCSIYERCPSENFTFVSDFYSIVREWSLVCDQSYFVSLITSIQMGGMLVGAIIIGPLSDLFGRKWTFFANLFLEFLISALSALAPDKVTFAVFRFFIGCTTGAEMVIGWVFAAETTINRYRLFIRVIGVTFLPLWNQVLVAYITKHWKWYSVIANLEGVPVLIILVFFTYESPRWLAQKGRLSEANAILHKIAKFNGTDHLLPTNVELETESKVGESKKYYAWDLFRAKPLAVYTVVCVIGWFATSMAYYGMFFNLGNLGTSVYVNGAIVAGVTMLVLPLAIYDTYNANVNRKYMLVAFFILTTLCNVLICVFLLFVTEGKTRGILLTVISSVGQVTTEGAFSVSYVFAIELFPTLLRGNANGLMGIGARVGAVIAPQLLYAGKFWTPLPYLCFAVVSATGAVISSVFLPNTKKMQLPETYQQANQVIIHNSKM